MTLAFVDRAHTSWGIRCIFVASHVDTDDRDQWQMLLNMHAMVDQFVIAVHSSNVRTGHEGAFEKRHVFGTISYGFFGEVIPGEFTPKGKPRRRLRVNPETAPIVQRIYDLFVNKHIGLNEIARLLNDDPSVPVPSLCRSEMWTDDVIKRLLKNPRYRGLWQYGMTESRFLVEEDYVRQVPRLEPLKQAQIEELRIVSDALWYEAQRRLSQNGHGYAGRKANDDNQEIRPRTLNGLLYCVEHDRPLVVSGANGRMMVCPVCQCHPAAKRPLVSWLNRKAALDLICKELACRIPADAGFVELVIGACKREAELNQRQSCGNVNKLTATRDKLQRAIDFAMSNIGETDDDKAATSRFVRQRRAEKAQIDVELSKLAAAKLTQVKVPSADAVRELLKELAKVLTDAGHSKNPTQRAVLRELIIELTGGKIVVSQQGERKRQRGWLRGTFQLQLLNTVIDRISDGVVTCDDGGREVSIDFKRPLETDTKAEIAWRLHGEKKRHAEIAKEIGCSGSYITKLLHHYADQHGLEWTDGRGDRRNFPIENRQPALFKQIAEQVMEMFQGKALLAEIAGRFDVHVATIRKAIKWWHEQRGLPVPNGRTRAGRLRRR